MSLARLAMGRPIATTMALIGAVLAGVYCGQRLPTTLLPEMDFGFLMVTVELEGLAPADMSRQVGEPLEGFLSLLHGLERLDSRSGNGTQRMMMRFADDVDMDLVRIEAWEKISAADLPDEAEISVRHFNPGDIPVIAFDLYGGSDKMEIQRFARDVLKRRLERLPGVGAVELNGDRQTEIAVDVRDHDLVRTGLSLADIRNALVRETAVPVGGRLREGRQELLVRIAGRPSTPEALRSLPLPNRNGPPVVLGDVAEVSERLAPTERRYRFNGVAAVMLEVSRRPGSNTLEVCHQIKDELDAAIAAHGGGIKADIYQDASKEIERSLSGLGSDLLTGLVVAVFVLALFLASTRSAIIIVVTVPVCIAIAMVPIYLAGVGLNMVSLIGFLLVSGMLVDNSIIILENIFRLLRLGVSVNEAIVSGAEEMRGAVIASTLTSMAVFVPIFILGGREIGFMRDLAYTAMFALGASLLVAFALVPLMAGRLIGGSLGGQKSNRFLGYFIRFSGLGTLSRRFLEIFVALSVWAQTRWWKRLVLVVAVLVFVVVGVAVKPDRDVAGVGENEALRIRLNEKGGGSLERMDGLARDVEAYVRTLSPRVEDISAFASPGSGFLYVELLDRQELEERAPGATFTKLEDLQKEMLSAFGSLPGIDVRIGREGGREPRGKTLSVEIKSSTHESLESVAQATARQLRALPSVLQVETEFDQAGEELRVEVDHRRAADLGASPTQVAQAVRRGLAGAVTFPIARSGDTIDVRIDRAGVEKVGVGELATAPITLAGGSRFPLERLANFEMAASSPELSRREGEFTTEVRMVYDSETGLEDLQKQIMNDEQNGLLDYQVLPPGVRYSWGGRANRMFEQGQDQQLQIISALLLVFLIMAAQLESLLQPIIMMTSLPLALAGGAIGAKLAAVPMNEMAVMGMIVLVGIVVNNAIVLVDAINELRRQGVDRSEAITEAVRIRTRPILMTMLTTVGALVPLLFGIDESAEYRRPMAVVVASGLASSTILTLVFIPAIYSLFDDMVSTLR